MQRTMQQKDEVPGPAAGAIGSGKLLPTTVL
jgi:hypothetical protein